MLLSWMFLGIFLVIFTKSDNGLAGLNFTTVASKEKLDLKTKIKTSVTKNKENPEHTSGISYPLSTNSGTLRKMYFIFSSSYLVA